MSRIGTLLGGETFLSTPSARRATALALDGREILHISIHALREEGDRFKRRQDVKLTLFLSTPSARRATHSHARCRIRILISIHALREEGDG